MCEHFCQVQTKLNLRQLQLLVSNNVVERKQILVSLSPQTNLKISNSDIWWTNNEKQLHRVDVDPESGLQLHAVMCLVSLVVCSTWFRKGLLQFHTPPP